MDTYIIVATHGRFAEGIVSSAELIMGKIKDIEAINCYCDDDLPTNQIIEKKVREFDYSNKHLLVITDLLGGSVNNEFMKYIHEFPFILVAGLNLALLLEILMRRDHLNQEEIIDAIEKSKNYTICCNTLSICEEDNDL